MESQREQYLITTRKDITNANFQLIQRFLTALRHPHPELIEITSCNYGPERYISWVGTPPTNWRYSSYYYMYGDGRIIDRPEGPDDKETIIWPQSKEQLKQFFGNNADILWFYIEIYRTFVQKDMKPHVLDLQRTTKKSHDPDGKLSKYRMAGDTSPITWRKANGKPMRTSNGYLFTENIYEDWKHKADAGHFISKGIHSSADLDRWLKRIGLHHIEDI